MHRMLVIVTLFPACGLFENLAPTIDIPVDVDLIEPASFDGSDAVGPATTSIDLDQTAPDASTPIADASTWGPLLGAHVALVDRGHPGLVEIQVSDFAMSAEGGPLQVVVDVSAGSGRILGDGLSEAPEAPESCTFVLEPESADEQTLADALLTCLVDWVSTNGAPTHLTVGLSAEVLTGLVGDFTLTGTWTLATTSPVEGSCELNIRVPGDVVDNYADLDVSAMSLRGTAGMVEGDMTLWAEARAYHSDGALGSVVVIDQAVDEGERYLVNADVTTVPAAGASLSVIGPASLDFGPSGSADPWLLDTLDALGGARTGAAGVGTACWFAIGDVPRDGFVQVELSGDASYSPL
jgi:hypothetical protein